MRDAASEAFHRVQRLSTDWRANNFAGSLVRKVTRGMWAFDALDDVVLLALLPSLVALFGTVALLAAHWTLLGLVMAVGALAYIALTVTLATRVLAPAARLSNQWDTKVSGMLADALGTNAVVKAFAAEAREDERLTAVLAKWARRTRRTWMRRSSSLTASPRCARSTGSSSSTRAGSSRTGGTRLYWRVRTASTAACSSDRRDRCARRSRSLAEASSVAIGAEDANGRAHQVGCILGACASERGARSNNQRMETDHATGE
ncbi:MAG TPA: ABC transporter transmembrane domain-containing protein [Allosphingosinicella sp.]|jgi:ABC-type multidrug transport system fused ATPase/permease subunit